MVVMLLLGVVERRLAILRLRFRVGLRVDEQLHDRNVALEARPDERRHFAILALRLLVCAGLQQDFYNLLAAVNGGHHERRPALELWHT